MRRPEPAPAIRTAAGVAARILALGMLAGVATAASVPARAAAPGAQAQAESRLMCYCGCTDLTVKVCNCGTAANIKADIAARIAAGASVDQVVDAYVAQYGEQIRSAPTRSGFNLLAWIMPFAAIVAGGIMVVGLVRRWRRDPGPLRSPDAPIPAVAGGSAAAPRSAAAEARLRERVEREMKESL
jgi:cytochrome c-type biogenesis protein CcmH